jgi:hypothetical protein
VQPGALGQQSLLQQQHHPVDARTTSDATQWRTEIGWPIFQTAKEGSKPGE